MLCIGLSFLWPRAHEGLNQCVRGEVSKLFSDFSCNLVSQLLDHFRRHRALPCIDRHLVGPAFQFGRQPGIALLEMPGSQAVA